MFKLSVPKIRVFWMPLIGKAVGNVRYYTCNGLLLYVVICYFAEERRKQSNLAQM